MSRSRCVRGTAALLCALGAAGLLGFSPASANPTLMYKLRAVAIPGFPGTGYALGAGAAIQAWVKVSGTEYAGASPPLTGVKFFGPRGAVLDSKGFATCMPAVLEQSGPRGCPKRSAAGPKGFALGTVSFGGERVPERVSVQPFFAPRGEFTVFIDGTTPTLLEVLAKGRLLGSSSSSSYGPELVGEIPLIETVPEAPYASFEEGVVSAGAAYRLGGKTISYITLPKRCPRGGWPTKAELSFLGGATAQATYTMPCPAR
jgi:hypothetical protein